MNFNFIRRAIIQHPTLSVFILTAVSYGVAFLYEQSRRTAYGVALPVESIKISSFVIAAICLIVAGMMFYILDRRLHLLIKKKIKDERSVVYTLNRIRMFFMVVVLATVYYYLPERPSASRDPVGEIFASYVMYAAIFLVFYYGISLLNTEARYIFSKDKKGYLVYLKKYTERIYKRTNPLLDNSPIWIISTLILIGLPTLGGLSAPYIYERYDIVRSASKTQDLMVVVDGLGSSLIVKEYNQKTHRFLEGYSIISIEGKDFYNLELKAEY